MFNSKKIEVLEKRVAALEKQSMQTTIVYNQPKRVSPAELSQQMKSSLRRMAIGI